MMPHITIKAKQATQLLSNQRAYDFIYLIIRQKLCLKLCMQNVILYKNCILSLMLHLLKC